MDIIMLDHFDQEGFLQALRQNLHREYRCEIEEAAPWQLHEALGEAVMEQLYSDWRASLQKRDQVRRAGYLSAEFLVGRAVYNNLLCLGVLDEVAGLLAQAGADIGAFEEIEDAALGNGGLGRLAACFLDSAATLDLPLDGYGIRYRYGLFRQRLVDGYQKEAADDWTRFGDPWSVRRQQDTVQVTLGDQVVNAVPYDMPILGWGTDNVGTLRLWQAEPVEEFDFTLFNDQHYDEAVRCKNKAEDISRVLYPNDSTREGKLLRLGQQYFFCSASLQSMLRDYVRAHGENYHDFGKWYALQLNDTHPVIAIPELIRLLMERSLDFLSALAVAQETFSYTNHTVMPEAMESWECSLLRETCPQVLAVIEMIDEHRARDLAGRGLSPMAAARYRIIRGGYVQMANLAVYVGHTVNGVAQLHTEILKETVLHDWYKLFPERFQNKTNGITQRRWLRLCNPELSALITRLLGDEAWVRDLERLKELERYAQDEGVMREFVDIKREKKRQLAGFIEWQEGIRLDENFLFDIQVKRLHEYKRQLLNALSILDIYYGLKEGRIQDFTPTAFIFGAKAAPGYVRAKAIIHFICEIAKMIDGDPEMDGKLKVVFVQNYNVSYAERLIPAADVSEQISTAGTEASGTGNMKFMLNGAVTLGTYDGANVEIVKAAGEENNYIFGARVEQLDEIRDSYDPKRIYEEQPRIRRVLDTLIDGTFSDSGNGEFAELHRSILEGASWHRADNYFLLRDFLDYQEKKLAANRDYRDRLAFSRRCWYNLCNAGRFSSDRTIREYARDIWKIEPVK